VRPSCAVLPARRAEATHPQLVLAAPAAAAAAQAVAPAAAPSPTAAGSCFVDKEGSKSNTVSVCHTAAVHNASARCSIFIALAFAVVFIWGIVHALRRNAAVRAVFISHAAALRARAAGVAPGSAERASLEAEAADVEAAAADWPQIMKDELVLNAPTRVGGSFFTNTNDKRGSYTVAQKEQAANERTALLSRHGVTAFAGVRETALRGVDFWRDGLFVVPLAVVLFGALAYWSSVTQCEAPLYQLCLKSTAPTYTCAFDAAGACAATPL
jgi:hypothetical protein